MAYATATNFEDRCPTDIWNSGSATQRTTALSDADDFAKGYLRAAGLKGVADNDAADVDGLMPAVVDIAIYNLGTMTNQLHDANGVLTEQYESAKKWLHAVAKRQILPVDSADLDSDSDDYNDAPVLLTAAF